MAKPTRKSSSKKLVKVKQSLRAGAKIRCKKHETQPSVSQPTEVIEISTDDEPAPSTRRGQNLNPVVAKTKKSRVRKVNVAGIGDDNAGVSNGALDDNGSDATGQDAPTMSALLHRFGLDSGDTGNTATQASSSSEGKRGRPDTDDDQTERKAKRKANRQSMIEEADGEYNNFLSVLKTAMHKSQSSTSSKSNKFLARLKETLVNEGRATKNPYIDGEAMEVDEGYASDEEPALDANGYDVGDGFVVPDDDGRNDEDNCSQSDKTSADDDNDSSNDEDNSGDDAENAGQSNVDVDSADSIEDDDDDHDTVLDTHARRASEPTNVEDMVNPSGTPVLHLKKPLAVVKEISRVRKEVRLGNLNYGKGGRATASGAGTTSAGKSRVLDALDEHDFTTNSGHTQRGDGKSSTKLLPAPKLVNKHKKNTSTQDDVTPLGTNVPHSTDDDDDIDEEEAQNFLRARVATLKAAAEKSKSAAVAVGKPSKPSASASTSKKKSGSAAKSSGGTTLQQLVADQSTVGRQLGDFAGGEELRAGGSIVEGAHGWLYDEAERRTVKYPAVNEVGQSVVVRGIMAPIYAKCPPLLKGVLVPWLKAKGDGLTRFDAWVAQCPTMSAELVFSAMSFVRLGDIVNPTHIDVRLLYAEEVVGGNSRSFIFIDGHVATFMSSVYVEHSQLKTASTVGLKIKSIRGIFHEMDYQRFVGVVAMTFNEFRMQAQLARDAIQFVTRGPSRKFGKGKAISGMFNNESSTLDEEGYNNTVPAGDSYVLASTDEIPIYDARDCPTFDFTTDIGNREELLPRWSDGEVPRGSFAVVGYSVNTYLNQEGDTTLSLNVMWVVVCGTPVKAKTAVRGKGAAPKTFTMADLEA